MMKVEGRIKELEVHTPEGLAGHLYKNANFTFNYLPEADTATQISVTMDIQNESYTRGALFPIFEMNLPEGYVRHYIVERLRKAVPIDDMLFLALSGKNGIGRISYESKQLSTGSEDPVNLDSIIHSKNSGEMFNNLVEKYLLKTSAGISGIQPKVMVPEERGTLALPSLILKSGNTEYPNIALNEFLCMSIAKVAGLRTPDFWITDDHQLFVMRRFDYSDTNSKLGMEDFSVLTGKSGDKKYEARYESLLRAANLYEVDVSEMYTQIVLSLIVGNGDAHLKNFAILYENIAGPYELSPIYDVVCTKAYGDETTALSINKSRNYPNRNYLTKLGDDFGVKSPAEIIGKVCQATIDVCGKLAKQFSSRNATFIPKTILENMKQVTGVRV